MKINQVKHMPSHCMPEYTPTTLLASASALNVSPLHPGSTISTQMPVRYE